MKIALILAVALSFTTACFTSAYEGKPGVPKNNQ